MHINSQVAQFQRCQSCRGEGKIWTECCNGANYCACEGKQLCIGQCQICQGAGKVEMGYNFPDLAHSPNTKLIKQAITPKGYIKAHYIKEKR